MKVKVKVKRVLQTLKLAVLCGGERYTVGNLN